MVRAFQMNLVYFDHKRNDGLEEDLKAYNEYLVTTGNDPVQVTFANSIRCRSSRKQISSAFMFP